VSSGDDSGEMSGQGSPSKHLRVKRLQQTTSNSNHPSKQSMLTLIRTFIRRKNVQTETEKKQK